MKKILFVCLGNICRSPTAEGVMNKLLEEKSLSRKIECDSAGTSSVHSGELPDSRSIKHALKRGVSMNSRSRPFDKSIDFDKFDLILVMDKNNLRSIKNQDLNNIYSEKIRLITDFCNSMKVEEVPDPYFSGDEGFETVLDILEDATEGLLKHLLQEG